MRWEYSLCNMRLKPARMRTSRNSASEPASWHGCVDILFRRQYGGPVDFDDGPTHRQLWQPRLVSFQDHPAELGLSDFISENGQGSDRIHFLDCMRLNLLWCFGLATWSSVRLRISLPLKSRQLSRHAILENVATESYESV